MPAKSPAALQKRKATLTRYRQRHAAELREYTRLWHRAHPTKAFGYQLRAKYDKTPGQIKAMLRDQDGKCAICRAPLEWPARGTHIDHDHATGAVRGILCALCNIGLGHVERPGWLALVDGYLSLYNLIPGYRYEIGSSAEIAAFDAARSPA